MKILTTILILFSNFLFSQNIKEIDSVAQNWCKEIETSTKENSSQEILKKSFEKIVLPYVENYDDSLKEGIFTKIFYRIQRLGCKKFYELNSDIEPESGSMKRPNKIPETKITNRYLKLFKDSNYFSYMENNGSITKVILDQNNWTSYFSDGTFSKYKLHWINYNEFEIIYIDSDNEARKNMNIVGDKYNYRIIDYSESAQSFTLIEYIPSVPKFAEFELKLDKKN
ncbi:hypothetical protein FO675_10925 [Riemerella anatipestifer]|uniref:hypothetical protein n=1 Tax=Riemerella anatipestifer TaxID=34085 RepID=UPI001AD61015|nr:hypothetical protein [Riemerella anatipestifer]MBO4234791.1 hypothetical protein [Riemerella anatipestifer]